MPLLIALLGLISIVGIWIWRMRAAADTVHDLLDVANDIRLAARRFGFRRTQNRHPVEDIEDPNIAIAALAVSFLELDDYPSQDEKAALMRALSQELNISASDAEEISVLGRWLMTQCGSAESAIDRLARKLYKLDGAQSFHPLMAILKAVLGAADSPMNGKQKTALEDIQTAFRIN